MGLNDEIPIETDNAHNLSSLQTDWTTLGVMDATAAAADGALGVTERNFNTSGILANSVQYLTLPPSWNSIEFQFEGPTDNENGIFDVYVGRRGSDIARRICTFAWIIGTQTGDGSGLEAVDTLTISNELWYSAVKVLTGTANVVGGFKFDLHGHKKVMLHGHTTFDVDLTVKVAGV